MTAPCPRLSAPALCLVAPAQRKLGLWLAVLGLAGALSMPAAAQNPSDGAKALPAVQPPISKTVAAPGASVGGPGWAELSVVERDILKPLAASWNALNPGHKNKWRQMAKNYPSLPTDEQAKMQGRMTEWVALSTQQRAQARLNFAKTKELSKELTTEEKKAKWLAYKSLSDEEKRTLAAKAPPKPVGAAATAKPVAPQKLATVPSLVDEPKGKAAPKIADAQPATGGTSQAPLAVPDAATTIRAP